MVIGLALYENRIAPQNEEISIIGERKTAPEIIDARVVDVLL